MEGGDLEIMTGLLFASVFADLLDREIHFDEAFGI
jgi:hypothetical protein